MHKTLLMTAFLLPPPVVIGQDQAEKQAAWSAHDDAAHAAGQCPSGPNCPVRPKPQPAPSPAPEPPHKPNKPLVPDLGLSREDLIALAFAAVLFGGAVWYFVQSERKQI
jgi:hypothetical protein